MLLSALHSGLELCTALQEVNLASNRLTLLEPHLQCPLLDSLVADCNALAAFPCGIPLLMLSSLSLTHNRQALVVLFANAASQTSQLCAAANCTAGQATVQLALSLLT